MAKQKLHTSPCLLLSVDLHSITDKSMSTRKKIPLLALYLTVYIGLYNEYVTKAKTKLPAWLYTTRDA